MEKNSFIFNYFLLNQSEKNVRLRGVFRAQSNIYDRAILQK